MHAAADIFDALGNPLRRAIVERLAVESCSVASLAETLPVSRPAVSRHLRVLADAGLVGHTADGASNVYHLEPSGFGPARAWLEQFWDDALARFVLVAENTAPEEAP